MELSKLLILNLPTSNMRKLSLSTISILIFLTSLNCQRSDTITISEIKDSCYVLMSSNKKDTLQASRQLEILENTFTDTTILGYAVLLPGYTGKFNYLRYGDNIVYSKDHEIHWPPTDRFCINLYKGRSLKGKLVIRFSY